MKTPHEHDWSANNGSSWHLSAGNPYWSQVDLNNKWYLEEKGSTGSIFSNIFKASHWVILQGTFTQSKQFLLVFYGRCSSVQLTQHQTNWEYLPRIQFFTQPFCIMTYYEGNTNDSCLISTFFGTEVMWYLYSTAKHKVVPPLVALRCVSFLLYLTAHFLSFGTVLS